MRKHSLKHLLFTDFYNQNLSVYSLPTFILGNMRCSYLEMQHSALGGIGLANCYELLCSKWVTFVWDSKFFPLPLPLERISVCLLCHKKKWQLFSLHWSPVHHKLLLLTILVFLFHRYFPKSWGSSQWVRTFPRRTEISFLMKVKGFIWNLGSTAA